MSNKERETIMSLKVGNSRKTLLFHFLLGVGIALLGIAVILTPFKLRHNYIHCGASLIFPGTEACTEKDTMDHDKGTESPAPEDPEGAP